MEIGDLILVRRSSSRGDRVQEATEFRGPELKSLLIIKSKILKVFENV